jgi:hypothetical protein
MSNKASETHSNNPWPFPTEHESTDAGVQQVPTELNTASTDMSQEPGSDSPLRDHQLFHGPYRDVRQVGDTGDTSKDHVFTAVARGPMNKDERAAFFEDLAPHIDNGPVHDFLADPEHQDREGIDFESINTFYGMIGMPDVDASTVIPVSEQCAAELIALRKSNGNVIGEDGGPNLQLGGAHNPLSGDTYVIRDGDLETANGGARYAEEQIFHEAFHRKSLHVTTITDNPNMISIEITPVRMGHSVMRYVVDDRYPDMSRTEGGPGMSLEEAVTSYYQRVFRQWRNGSPNGAHGGNETAVQAIGRRVPTDPSDPEGSFVVENYTLPIRHMDANPNDPGKLMLNDRVLGGAAVELLVRIEPKLFDAFLEARVGPEGMRKVAQLMNSIEPSLYHTMLTITEQHGNDKLLGMSHMFFDAVRIARAHGLDDQTMWTYDWRNIPRLRNGLQDE